MLQRWSSGINFDLWRYLVTNRSQLIARAKSGPRKRREISTLSADQTDDLSGQVATEQPGPKQAVYLQSSKRLKDSEANFDLKRLAQPKKEDAELRAKLHGKGVLGSAFRKLVEKGCDERWLERCIVDDRHAHPWRSSRNPLGRRELNELLGTVQILRRQAGKIEPFLPLLIGRVALHDPDVAGRLAEAPTVLRKLAKELKFAHEKSEGRHAFELVASKVIPDVIGEVRKATGSPHFSEIATLYGGAYGKDVSAEQLRTLESRKRKRLGATE